MGCRSSLSIHYRDGGLRGLGRDRAHLQLQRYLAIGHQYGNDVLTFLMVFVLQHSQNRDSIAIQAKLDELILNTTDARNELVEAEKLTEKELEMLRQHRAKRGVGPSPKRKTKSPEPA